MPEPGLKWEPEPIPEEDVVKEAKERKRAVIYLALNPPESRGETAIYALNLSEAVKIYQVLLKYAFKKAITQLSPETRRNLDLADNYRVKVRGFSPGSFTIHMESENPADALGFVELAKGLRRLDDFFGATGDQDKVIEILKQNKGHLIGVYRKLLNLIVEQNSPISYRWAMPELEKGISRTITRESALSISEILNAKTELSVEEKVFIGRVIVANVPAGTWTLSSEEDGKEYRGSSDREISLGGITLETKRYRLVCEEHLEEESVTGREKTLLILKSFKEI